METIKGTVDALLENLKSRVVRGGGVEEIILGAFSKKEREHIRVIPCRGGRVKIAVDSSTWLYYFNLRKKELFQKIVAHFPEAKEISFIIGEIGEIGKRISGAEKGKEADFPGNAGNAGG